LVAAISAFITEASSVDADLFVVATTRPQGYRDEFSEALHTATFRLTEFSESEALAYAESIINIRSQEDPLLATQVTDRLFYAVHQRLTQRLMTSPLQVTIMTALAERAVELPTTRYELFDAYYSTIYDREVGKSEEFRRLAKLRSHIDFLHEQAGLLLQVRGEDPSEPDPLLPQQEVARVLRKRLRKAGFEEAESRQRTEELLALASDRIVLLVSPHGNNYGFEVRSIQEYMAARALTEGADEVIIKRLQVLIPSAHWRNVWLLAAGRIFELREHLSAQLIEMIQEHDVADVEQIVTRSGAGLAADLYLDDIASEFPALRLSILETALTALRDTSADKDPAAISVVMASVGEGGGYEQKAINCIDALSQESLSNGATKLLNEYRHSPDPIGRQARESLSLGRNYSKPKERDDRDRAFVLASYVAPTIKEPAAGAEKTAVELFVDRLSEAADNSPMAVASRSGDAAASPQTFYSVLDDAEVRAVLVATIGKIQEREPDIAYYATAMLRYRASRLARGHELPL